MKDRSLISEWLSLDFYVPFLFGILLKARSWGKSLGLGCTYFAPYIFLHSIFFKKQGQKSFITSILSIFSVQALVSLNALPTSIMVFPLKNPLYASKSPVNNQGSYSPWEPLTQDSSKETLLQMLLDMYWSGVYREVNHILISLSELRDTTSAVEQEYRSDDPLRGLDTFTNQVSEQKKDWIKAQGWSLIIHHGSRFTQLRNAKRKGGIRKSSTAKTSHDKFFAA